MISGKAILGTKIQGLTCAIHQATSTLNGPECSHSLVSLSPALPMLRGISNTHGERNTAAAKRRERARQD